ncbi:hypothetical protein ACHHYP_12772 [Achlya hypogyna]|uniref:Secreted protein n=1 Tax=Achlya hypogyna TaxID=1202772 RepID=A0A0A7CP95_ACHHY|nr:secreted protein [Achlya hypogyna]OQR84811.1 hypothetical protein ACHHYP_12772 [Achlya hypogyna]
MVAVSWLWCFGPTLVAAEPQGLGSFFQGIISDIKHAVNDLTFRFEHLVDAEPVTGFCGPDALRAFDNYLATGALVRHDAYPKGVLDLVGSTLATLDGSAFATRQAAFLNALSPAAVQRYKSTVHNIVQADHATWAARGGTFSLANAAKVTTFKVVLAVVLGLDNPEAYTGYRSQIDEYLALLAQTEWRAPADAVTIRSRLLAALIRPAVVAAHARATPKSCVVDALVEAGTVSDEDLATELFQLLVHGIPGLEGLVVHSLTAIASVDGVRAHLASARDVYMAKYYGAARWDHFDDLGYGNQFLLEVQRTYTASPRQEYARATVDLKVLTPTGTTIVPKNRLKVGVLECLNKDAKRWPNPTSFDPTRFASANTSAYAFAPYAMNLLADRRRGVGEALSQLVLQTHLVSLWDFAWTMAPRQSYALADSPNPSPVDALTTDGFFVAPGAVVDTEAWRRLHQPDVQLYNASIENPLLAAGDKRLDFFTHSAIQLFNTRYNLWVKPSASAITVPKVQKVLPKRKLYGTAIQIPTEDEDVDIPKALLEAAKLIQDTAPFVDNFDAKWLPGEDMEDYVLSKVGHMWPRVRVHWDDRYSDRALELLVFHGLGQHLVTKLPHAHDDGSYYTVALDFLGALEVRSGFAKLGADGFFTKDGKVTKIVRQGVTYLPGAAKWEYAKLCFRGSLNAKITAVDHLIGLHVTVGNYMTTATREQLPPKHPVRRLLKPFTFRAVAINYEASNVLFAPKGLLQRAFPLTEKGMAQTWVTALKDLKLETFPQHIARQQVDTMTLPFHHDGTDYWNIVRRFTSNYLDLYYKDDTAVTSDASLQSFWRTLSAQLPMPLPPLGLAVLKDTTAIGIFLVTAMHNHLGGIAEYVSDPAFCPTAWVEGEIAGRPGSCVCAAVLMAGTGYLQPNVMEDFSHVLLDDAAKAVARNFTTSLQAFTDIVRSRNAQRLLAYRAFDATIMDMAIGI